MPHTDSGDQVPARSSAQRQPSPERPSPEKRAFFDKRLSDRPETFEDFALWQEARRFVNRVFEATGGSDLAAIPGVREELRRASIEAMSHLAAAAESGHDRQFTYGLRDAVSSAARARSLMYVTIDRGQLPESEANELIGRANSLKQMIESQLTRLKRADLRNSNRKPSGPRGKKPYGKPGNKRGKW